MATSPQVDFITASEIAEYLYCNRACWLKLKGFTSRNIEALAQGSASHTEYSQQVEQVIRSASLGKRVIFVGIILFVLFNLIRLLIH
ncbi:MAG: hypothetical protein H0X30_00230 [Anaerolineae bacterium]|nr:hypothetical protein [Anaerolineae bacterium]